MEINLDKEYYNIVKEILESDEFQKRKNYKHHNDSVYDHCIKVSYISYKISKKLGLDYQACAIAGLLHDFYKKPWQNDRTHKPLFKQHGFVHAKEASINASKYFPKYMNKKVIDCIKRHMFPLNIIPPKYIEGWIITMVDKYVSMDVFKKPANLYKYVGIKENSNLMNCVRKSYLNFILVLYAII